MTDISPGDTILCISSPKDAHCVRTFPTVGKEYLVYQLLPASPYGCINCGNVHRFINIDPLDFNFEFDRHVGWCPNHFAKRPPLITAHDCEAEEIEFQYNPKILEPQS